MNIDLHPQFSFIFVLYVFTLSFCDKAPQKDFFEKPISIEKIDSNQTGKIDNQITDLALDSLQLYYIRSERGDFLYGYKNRNGEIIVEAEYHGLGNPSNQRIRAYKRIDKEDYIGYLDLNGHVIIPLVYNAGGHFQNNSVLVRDKNGNKILIDTSGQIQVELTQALIDSLITKPFFTSNFEEFKSCVSQLQYEMFYASLLNCSDFLFSKQIWVKSYETCPSPIGSGCSTTTSYGLYEDGYFIAKGLYEGFRNDIYLSSVDEKIAKKWLISFTEVFGYRYIKERNRPNGNGTLIEFINSDNELKASATIICDTTYCKISPYTINIF